LLGKTNMEGLSRGLDSRRERSGNIRVDLARANNAEKWPNSHSPSGCIESSAARKPLQYSLQDKGAKWAGGCVGFAVTARRGDAPANPPCPRPILNATDAMRFNQRFPRRARAISGFMGMWSAEDNFKRSYKSPIRFCTVQNDFVPSQSPFYLS
jgi:hypothetical protein